MPQPSGGTILHATTDAAQYRSALPRDAVHKDGPRRDAYGRSCQWGLTFPISPPTPFYGSNYAVQYLPTKQPLEIHFGDAGFATAVTEARKSVQDAAIYDVRVDLHTIALLSIVRRDCLEIHAAAETAPTTKAPAEQH